MARRLRSGAVGGRSGDAHSAGSTRWKQLRAGRQYAAGGFEFTVGSVTGFGTQRLNGVGERGNRLARFQKSERSEADTVFGDHSVDHVFIGSQRIEQPRQIGIREQIELLLFEEDLVG